MEKQILDYCLINFTKKIFKIVIVSLLYFSCDASKKLNIRGTWCLTSTQINYPKIEFINDSIVELRSLADTFYSYKYRIENNILIVHQSGGEISMNIFRWKGADTIIFESLLENRKPQTYVRCKY